MSSLKYAVFTIVFGISYGLNDMISPCGVRLCRDLCESLSSCSSPVYQEETITCVIRNRSLGVDPGGVRECRTLTSRRGISVNLCSTADTKKNAKKGKQKKIKGKTRKPFCEKEKGNVNKNSINISISISNIEAGTPVLLSNNLYGIYIGNNSVVFLDRNLKTKQEVLSSNLTIINIAKYTTGIPWIKRSGLRIVCAKRFIRKQRNTFVYLQDLITISFVGQTCVKADRSGFKILP